MQGYDEDGQGPFGIKYGKDAKDNKKGFLIYISRKRKAGKNMRPVLKCDPC